MDIKNFKTHRPIDPTDPGFSIPGVRFRWIAGRVRESSSTSGIWQTFKKSALPAALVEHINRHYPGAFSEGDTIRRGNGELTLAYATVEEANKHRSYLNDLSREQASRARILPAQKGATAKDFSKIETYEGTESTIPDHFLKKKDSE